MYIPLLRVGLPGGGIDPGKIPPGFLPESLQAGAGEHNLKRYKKILLACLVLIMITAMLPMQPVHAAGAIGNVDSFDNLAGDARYLGSAYRDNYYLDMEETGLLDAIPALLNSISNVLFGLVRWLSYLTVSLFYTCFNLNIAELFGTQANNIQAALNSSIFQPLFLLGCGVSFCILAVRIVKQDLAGAVGQLAKIIGIVMLSAAALTHSGTVLSYCTNITKEISVSILSGVNSVNGFSANVSGFAAQGAGVLWQNLVHEPWLTMEFGNDSPSADDIELFLTTPPESDARDALVEARPWECFSMGRSGGKATFMLLYLIPCIIKCVVYILVAVIQLVFQLLAVFYVFMAPLILIISLMPGYERMLGLWLRKILESQISILIITLMIGILIKLDQLLYDWARNTQAGWMIALVLQVAMAVALIMNRDKLVNMMSNIQRGVATPGFGANRFKMNGNIYQKTVPDALKFSGKIGKKVYNAATDPVYNAIERRKTLKTETTEAETKKSNEDNVKPEKTFTKQTDEKKNTVEKPANSNPAVRVPDTPAGVNRQQLEEYDLSDAVPDRQRALSGKEHRKMTGIKIQETSSNDKPLAQRLENNDGLQNRGEHPVEIIESKVSGSAPGAKETERPVLMPGSAGIERNQNNMSVNVTVHLEMEGERQTVSGTAGDSSNEIRLRTVPGRAASQNGNRAGGPVKSPGMEKGMRLRQPEAQAMGSVTSDKAGNRQIVRAAGVDRTDAGRKNAPAPGLWITDAKSADGENKVLHVAEGEDTAAAGYRPQRENAVISRTEKPVTQGRIVKTGKDAGESAPSELKETGYRKEQNRTSRLVHTGEYSSGRTGINEPVKMPPAPSPDKTLPDNRQKNSGSHKAAVSKTASGKGRLEKNESGREQHMDSIPQADTKQKLAGSHERVNNRQSPSW